MRETAQAHAMLVAVSLIWGMAFVAIEASLSYMNWVTLLFLRFSIASGIFAAAILVSPHSLRRIERKDLPTVFLLGFLAVTVYHSFLNAAQESITAGEASLVISSTPAIILGLSFVFLKEKVTAKRVLGVAVAFIGLTVMIMLGQSQSLSFQLSVGSLLVLVSAISAALQVVIGKSLLSKYRAFPLVTITLLAGTLLTMPLPFVFLNSTINEISHLALEGLVPVVFLSIGPTFLAYALWYRALDVLEASAVGVYAYPITMVAVLGGVILLAETVTIPLILGGITVGVGTYIAQRA